MQKKERTGCTTVVSSVKNKTEEGEEVNQGSEKKVV